VTPWRRSGVAKAAGAGLSRTITPKTSRARSSEKPARSEQPPLSLEPVELAEQPRERGQVVWAGAPGAGVHVTGPPKVGSRFSRNARIPSR